MSEKMKIEWLDEPEEHNYPAALSYLSLIYNEQKATTCIKKMKRSRILEFKAKDIFRASGLSLLGISNAHVGVVADEIGIDQAPRHRARFFGAASAALHDGGHEVGQLRRRDRPHSVDLRLGRGRGAFEEIEIAALVGLRDVR